MKAEDAVIAARTVSAILQVEAAGLDVVGVTEAALGPFRGGGP
ncbi:hypothetical protein [Spirillospora sp. NPDC048819]